MINDEEHLSELEVAARLLKGGDLPSKWEKLLDGIKEKYVGKLETANSQKEQLEHELKLAQAKLTRWSLIKWAITVISIVVVSIVVVVVVYYRLFAPNGDRLDPSPSPPTCSHATITDLYLHKTPGGGGTVPLDEPVIAIETPYFHLSPESNVPGCGYHWIAFYGGGDFDEFRLRELSSSENTTVGGDTVDLLEKSECYLDLQIIPFDESTRDEGIPRTFRFIVEPCSLVE